MQIISIALLGSMLGCAFVQPVPAAEVAKFKEKVLYSFGSGTDGANPYDSVIDVEGTLYGTTYAGGNSDSGTVFALQLNTDVERVIYSFDDSEEGPEGSMRDVKGTLYGTTSGADGLGGMVFSIDPNTDEEKTLYKFCSQPRCADGESPVAGLINVKSVLYGTTFEGGGTGCDGYGCGAVFSIDPKTGIETVLYSFAGEIDGEWPNASLIDVNGMLYGTTEYGGGSGCIAKIGCGTVFSVDPNTGTEKVLYSFCSQANCADGANPSASLINVKGTLYGTTEYG